MAEFTTDWFSRYTAYWQELFASRGWRPDTPRTVIFDCIVDKTENCLPMIPSGKAHNEMILPDTEEALETAIDQAGKMLV